MKLKKLLFVERKSKKAWLRIVEAFIAILLIMSTLVIILQKQKIAANSNEEIQIKQKDILNMIVKDDSLRAEILSWKATQTNEKVRALVPSGYNYSIELCSYEKLCPLNFTVPTAVYSDETIIISNLTHYVANEAVKIKIYFWKGSFPTGQNPHNYSEILPH